MLQIAHQLYRVETGSIRKISLFLGLLLHQGKIVPQCNLGQKFRDTSHVAIILCANRHNFCFTQSFHIIFLFHNLLVAWYS